MAARHTIVLLQPHNNTNSRTYYDYESVSKAMDGICQLFETQLKRNNPTVRNITYDISDLYKYIDNLPDLSCLVFTPETNMYAPFNKDWIKQKIFAHLKRQAM
eukprot:GEZU01000378.1.p1 GENE.GEZU01000378.1~~GEZU01000378.1.p1  ORF type:complete len:103 (+),score=22.61 GEZU01000378.1:91-399(+)